MEPKQSQPFEDPYGKRIVAIEYHKEPKKGWLPHSVVSERSTFDFDYCRNHDQVYYHDCGSGQRGLSYRLHGFVEPGVHAKLWVDALTLEHDGKVITKKDALALGYRLVAEPIDGNPFDEACESSTDYCIICDDRFPDDQMCNHVYYQEGGDGNCLGCGSSEVDFDEAQKSLFLWLRTLDLKVVAILLENLQSGKFDARRSHELLSVCCGPKWLAIDGDELEAEIDGEERYWPGIAWLYSLPPKGPQTALTAGWVWMFQRLSGRGKCILPQHILYVQMLPGHDLLVFNRLWDLDVESYGYQHELQEVKYLYTPPNKARDFHEKSFMKEPKSLEVLWLRDDGGDRSMTISVAHVDVLENYHYQFTFGRIYQRNRDKFYIKAAFNG